MISSTEGKLGGGVWDPHLPVRKRAWVELRVAAATRERLLMSDPCDPMDLNPPGSCPWDSPGKNTGMGCHFLLQGILPTLGPNAQLLHWQVDFSPTEPPGKPEYSYLHLESGLAFDLLRTVEWSRNEVV